jgi:glycosyltransferase involved in cell wall biosynthesis
LAETKSFIKVIILEKNIGPGLARNIGIKAAQGKYIALLDSDDEWLDERKLENQRKFLDEHSEYVLVGGAETEFVRENGKPLFIYRPKTDDSAIRSKILISNQFTTSSTMFKKDAFEKVGGFAAMYLAEDYDLWLRLAQEGKIANIQGCKTRYYSRLAGIHQNNKRKMNAVVIKLVKHYKKHFPHPWMATLMAYVRAMLNLLN